MQRDFEVSQQNMQFSFTQDLPCRIYSTPPHHLCMTAAAFKEYLGSG